MDDEGKTALRKRKGSHVPWMKTDRGMMRQVGGLGTKRLQISREDKHRRIEPKMIIRPDQAFKQPAPKKPRPSSEEDPLSSKPLPYASRVPKNMVQVFN